MMGVVVFSSSNTTMIAKYCTKMRQSTCIGFKMLVAMKSLPRPEKLFVHNLPMELPQRYMCCSLAFSQLGWT